MCCYKLPTRRYSPLDSVYTVKSLPVHYKRRDCRFRYSLSCCTCAQRGFVSTKSVGIMVFNKQNINFNKEKKKKARIKRKALKLEQKHKVTKKNVSGARTKKSLRKQAHKERVAEKVAATMGDEQMADVSKSSIKRKTAKKKRGGGGAAAAGAAGKAADATAGDTMQE